MLVYHGYHGAGASAPPCGDLCWWRTFCMALEAIDTGLNMLKSLFRPTAEIQHTDLHETWKNTVIPLHPGAQAYYRDKGYMA